MRKSKNVWIAVLDISEEHARRMYVLDYLTNYSGKKVLTSRGFEDQESAAKVADLLGAYLYDNWEYLTDDAAEKFKTLTQSQLKKKVLKELSMKVRGRPPKSVVRNGTCERVERQIQFLETRKIFEDVGVQCTLKTVVIKIHVFKTCR